MAESNPDQQKHTVAQTRIGSDDYADSKRRPDKGGAQQVGGSSRHG